MFTVTILCLFFSFLSFFHFLITACLLDCQCLGQQLSKYYFRDRFFHVLNCSHSFTDACEFRMNGLISSTDTIKQRLIPFLEGKKIKHIELKELCCKSAWHWPSERSFFFFKEKRYFWMINILLLSIRQRWRRDDTCKIKNKIAWRQRMSKGRN